MKMGRSRVLLAVLAGTAATVGTAAQAQSWGVYVGNGPGYGGYRQGWSGGWGGDDRVMRSVCSGERAYRLEDRLRHEEGEDEIDPRTARRIHRAIDRLEDRQRHECAEGDWRSVRDIAIRYDQIGQWIDGEAHGYRERW